MALTLREQEIRKGTYDETLAELRDGGFTEPQISSLLERTSWPNEQESMIAAFTNLTFDEIAWTLEVIKKYQVSVKAAVRVGQEICGSLVWNKTVPDLTIAERGKILQVLVLINDPQVNTTRN